jgi:PAS domain S-box-containing protein
MKKMTLIEGHRNLSLLIDAIPAFIGVMRSDGTIQFANQRVLDYMGVSLEQVQKEGFRSRVHPEDVERLREERLEALKHPIPFENEQRVLGGDGKYRWFLIRYNPVFDKHGQIDRWYVCAFDIEDRKRAEDVRLEERTRIARELHDTMLQSFQGALFLFQAAVERLPHSPDVAKAKEKLETAIDHAEQAVAEGRDAVQGLRSSAIATNDLAVVLSNLSKDLTASEANRNPPASDVHLQGEPKDLDPVLRDEVCRIAGEALRNAFRHAHANRIEVEIYYGTEQFRVRIRDDGKGLAPEVVADKGRPGHYGLRGMHERAKLVGGNLEVRSKPDYGTEIELVIPASTAYTIATTQLRSWFSRNKTVVKSEAQVRP